MNKKLRSVAIIIGSGFVIFLVLNTILNRVLSEERLKEMLVIPAQNELGRLITIGSAKVSLLRGITISDIRIKEQDSSQDFISVEKFQLRYELLPLLQKKLIISKLIVDRPTIRIIRGSNGLFHFANIGKPQVEKEKEIVPVKEDKISEPLPFTITFDKVEINNANITLTDETDVLPEVKGEAGLAFSIILGKDLADTRFNGSFNLLANGKYHGHKPVLQLTCSISEELISYSGYLTLGFDRLDLEGTATNYLSTPVIELNLNVNSIDLEKLASLKQFISETPEQKHPGPTKQAKAANSIPPNNEPPVNLKMSVRGQLNIGKISKGQLIAEEVALNYLLKDNIIKIDGISAQILGGNLTGNISANISEEQPTFAGVIKEESIKVSEIMVALEKPSETFSGEMNADLSFQGSGKDWSIIQNTLNAKGNFTIADGGFQQTPLTSTLATLLNIQELNDLRFMDFSGDLTIADGTVSLNSDLQSKNINIQADGNIGLDGVLDLPLVLQLSPEFSNNSSITRYIKDEEGHATLHMNATGSIQKPKLSIDSKTIKDQATKVITSKIMEKLGGSTTNSNQTNDIPGLLLKQLMGK